MKKSFTISVLFCLILLAFSGCGNPKKAPNYEFTSVSRGTLERTVSSSGTINPVSTVKVLPQMSGKVEKIYRDYNDMVKKGDILAELNTDVLKLRREQQYAAVVKARANFELQEINYRNQTLLAEKNLISEYELKTSKTTLDSNRADLAVAEANLKEIETEINQYAYITSPIDGIVLDRKINVGDTVVDSSSSNTTSIFTLAENLREMQIEAGVGELDVVSVKSGQPVRFSLESLPGRSFQGTVETLRLVPVVTNNVVSYTVIVKVENHDGSLLPGMTCAVDFIVEQSENALMVSNAALRYEPTTLGAEEIAEMVFSAGLENLGEEERKAAVEEHDRAQPAEARNANQNNNSGLAGLVMGQGGRMPGFSGGGRPRTGQTQTTAPVKPAVTRNLWHISPDGKPALTRVRTGITNGTFTELVSAEALEGRQVILREKI